MISPEEVCAQHEIARQVQRELNRLPPIFRQVLVLVDMCGINYSEAAQALGVPTGTVKSRLARARAALRLELLPERQAAGERPTMDRSHSFLSAGASANLK